ncbi:hypothetical protein ACS0TY_012244 [Phlomoides rotata]
MALLRRFFYKKPPEGLLEISERVYVFDCCFTTNKLEGVEYGAYIERIVDPLREYFPDASFMVFSFGDGDQHKQITNVLSKYGITLVDYPSHYENCPLLTVEMLHHFLRSSESWLCIGQRNIILMHCKNGAFPILAFMLAAFLIYRKQYVGEKRTLDMVYKQSSSELLHLQSSLDSFPSQMRYLQYVSRRNIGSRWPPFDRALTLDRIILRSIPDMDRKGGCRPIFRIYGPDPLMASDRNAKMLFSTPKKSRAVGYFKQAHCGLVKIGINCHVQGDVVLECFSLDDNLEHEEMMFRVMFNTAFIRSNVLILNLEEIDSLWNVKDRFPNDFRAEVLFTDMDSSSSSLVELEFSSIQDIEGLPVEAFGRVQDIFNDLDWGDSEREHALNIIREITVSSILEEKDELTSFSSARTDNSQNVVKDELEIGYEAQKGSKVESPKLKAFENETRPSLAEERETTPASSKSSLDLAKKNESCELHVSVQRPAQSKIISPSKLTSYSSSSPAPVSRYRSAPSALGITALLHEFRNKEHSSISASTPYITEPVEPAKSSVSPPEKHHLEQPSPPLPTSVPPPTPPPPPPPPMQSTSILSSTPTPSPVTAPYSPPPPHSSIPPLPLPQSSIPPPPPPIPSLESSSIIRSDSSVLPEKRSTVPVTPPPPPPPPQCGGSAIVSPSRSLVPPPPPPRPPGLVQTEVQARSNQAIPPPPAPLLNASPRSGNAYFKLHSSASTLLGGKLRANTRIPSQSKRTTLKPYHWLKLTRAMQGSLWAEAQKPEEASKAPELDMSELESLFSATAPTSGAPGGKTNRHGAGLKSDKVHLIELRRAYNCEIMLSKVKIPLSDLMNSVLDLDDSALDIDQVDNLIKFCPTKEEIELLKNYKDDKENLGKCEQFFLEMIKVPRVESKLRVFSFKMQFSSQVSDLRNNLNVVNSASEEVRNSVKLKRIMQTILQLGNALNHGTARGSAVGFRLDSLPKLAETRARNNKLTLIHYLCKVLAEKLPDVLDFHEGLVNLEAATKIQLKYLAEEMQAINKGLEKVVQELAASENDGAVSEHFCQTLKQFLGSAEAEVRSLASLYSGVGRNADALAPYFGEDPARCPFEQVVSTLLNFVRMFKRAHEENCKQLEFEKKKKAQEEAETKKADSNTSRKESENDSMKASAAKTSELQPQL